MRYETVDILFPIRVQKVGTDIDETYVILRMRERLVIDSSSQFIGCQTFHIVECLVFRIIQTSGGGFPPHLNDFLIRNVSAEKNRSSIQKRSNRVSLFPVWSGILICSFDFISSYLLICPFYIRFIWFMIVLQCSLCPLSLLQ